jgi:hypothetical protein
MLDVPATGEISRVCLPVCFNSHADAAFPLLPAKSYSLFRDNSAEFIEARRASLETWIRSVFESFPSVLISPPLAGLLKLR